MKKKPDRRCYRSFGELGKALHGSVAKPAASVEKKNWTREELRSWSNPLVRVVGFIPHLKEGIFSTDL